MSRNIDYSNTIIYKIICNDSAITDLYVGHTTNFEIRKYSHKNACVNSNIRLYKTIRENGGWNNWNMVEIATFNCKNINEAKQKEQEYYESLNATLNSIPPININKTHNCKISNYVTNSNKCFNSHNLSKQNENNVINIETENNKNYKKMYCVQCKYSTIRNSQYERHLLTQKHKKLSVINKSNVLHESNVLCENNLLIKLYKCKCGKQYKHASSYCFHKTKCLMLKQEKTNALEKKTDNTEDIIKQLIVATYELINELRKNENK